MKQYEVSMTATVGYVVRVTAENEEDAKDLAYEQACDELSYGWGLDIDFRSIDEINQ